MRAETAKALIEMMRLAAKQFANYDGPVIVTICPDREDQWREFAERLPGQTRETSTTSGGIV